MSTSKVKISNGELVDKMTILEIKLYKIPDNEYIKKEYLYLFKQVKKLKLDPRLITDLVMVNKKLWELEERIRWLEGRNHFGAEFIEAARQIYTTNDQRFKLKSDINEMTKSKFREQKSLPKY